MGLLGEALGRANDEEGRRAPLIELQSRHGNGWRATTGPAHLMELASEFIERLVPSAGQDAYWVRFGDGQTVHLPPRRPSWDTAAERKRSIKAHARAMKSDRLGEARVLRIGDSWSSTWPTFVMIRGVWSPAEGLYPNATTEWSDASDDHRDRVLSAMLAYYSEGTTHPVH